MGVKNIRLASMLSFDDKQEADIINLVESLNASHRMGEFMSNLVRLAFDNPEIIEKTPNGQIAFGNLIRIMTNYGRTPDRKVFVDAQNKQLLDMQEKVDAIYNMCLQMYTMAEAGKVLGFESKVENMIIAEFMLEQQLSKLKQSLGVDCANKAFASNKINNVKENAADNLAYIVSCYEPIISALKQELKVKELEIKVKELEVPVKEIEIKVPSQVSVEKEPEQVEPKAEPVKAEPVKAEPVKAEPVKAEPVKAEPVKAEPVKAEPVMNQPQFGQMPMDMMQMQMMMAQMAQMNPMTNMGMYGQQPMQMYNPQMMTMPQMVQPNPQYVQQNTVQTNQSTPVSTPEDKEKRIKLDKNEEILATEDEYIEGQSEVTEFSLDNMGSIEDFFGGELF